MMSVAPMNSLQLSHHVLATYIYSLSQQQGSLLRL